MKDKDINLFTPVVPRERWHPNFARIAESASQAERDVLAGWASGFRDRDGKFAIEFQTTFNSSFWELYLFALFRSAGCILEQQHSRPDFVAVGGPLGEFTAEAVIASNPDGAPPEWTWDPTRTPAERDTLLDLACLRLSQALVAKHKKWESGYSTLQHCKGRPFIVCVGPFEQPWASLQGTEAIDRVLFMGARPIISEHGGTPHVMGHTATDAVFKPTGGKVPLGLFTEPALSGVSAVLFSSLATWSKVRALSAPEGRDLLFHAVRFDREREQPFQVAARGGEYVETLEDGAHLFLNPFAETPIDADTFFDRGLAVHRYSSTGTLTRLPEGLLMSRIAYELRTAGDTPLPSQPVREYVPHHRAVPPDGIPFGPSEGLNTDSGTLELYRGWTIFVARDRIDNDWMAGAEPETCLSMEELRVVASKDTAGFITESMATRDAAVAEARRRIDALVDGYREKDPM